MKKYLLSILLIASSICSFGQSLLTGLSAYWKFEETNGTNVSVVSEVNNVTLNSLITSSTMGQTGKIDNCFTYAVGNDYVASADVSLLQMGTSDCAISAWIYPTTLTNSEGGYGLPVCGGTTGSMILFVQSTTGKLVFGAISVNTVTSNLVVTANNWHHVAASYDQTANEVTVWLDGVSETISFSTTFTAGTYLIGQSAFNTSNEFVGKIDELGIWKRKLTSNEVLSLYNSGDGFAYPFAQAYNPTQFVPSSRFGRSRPTYGTSTVYMTYSTSPLIVDNTDSFEIYFAPNAWEYRDIGTYPEDEQLDDFGPLHVAASSGNPNLYSITFQDVDGVQTKVLTWTHPALAIGGWTQSIYINGVDYDEIYFSYLIKLDEEFENTGGGKMPGLEGTPSFPTAHPTANQGYRNNGLIKYYGVMSSYHYDHTYGYSPWASQEDTVFMRNGHWHEITERNVMNTFTNGVGNLDGISEWWLDGKLILQESNICFFATENSNWKIDALRIGMHYGGGEDEYPLHEVNSYVTKPVAYRPLNDATWGTRNLHDPNIKIQTPHYKQRLAYYDTKVTTEGTLENSQYGSNYSNGIDEVWLVEAPLGYTVRYTVSTAGIGSGDGLFFYDGQYVDSRELPGRLLSGNYTNRVFNSTGRWMYIRFSSSKYSPSTGFTGTVSFIP